MEDIDEMDDFSPERAFADLLRCITEGHLLDQTSTAIDGIEPITGTLFFHPKEFQFSVTSLGVLGILMYGPATIFWGGFNEGTLPLGNHVMEVGPTPEPDYELVFKHEKAFGLSVRDLAGKFEACGTLEAGADTDGTREVFEKEFTAEDVLTYSQIFLFEPVLAQWFDLLREPHLDSKSYRIGIGLNWRGETSDSKASFLVESCRLSASRTFAHAN